jgi:hypothetical protein
MNYVAVAPHTRFFGFDGVREKVPEVYRVRELREALGHRYHTDAHLVCYVVRGAERQPRINKPGLPHFGRPVEMDVFFADVDNPEHAAWTDEMADAAREQYDTLEILQTAGIYHTAHGRRIVQPLAKPIPVQEVEPYIRDWFLRLERSGLAVDWACRDWTRHYRLPNVNRGGSVYRSPLVALDRMQPITPPVPTSTWQVPATPMRSTSPSSPPPQVPRIDWTTEIPPFWHERVETIAKAVGEVQTEWHTLFLAIAGALLSRKVPPEHVPALCRAISLATGKDTRTDDREVGARSTVQRKLMDLPATGYTHLVAKWPEVAMAIDMVTATGPEARMLALATQPSPDQPLPLEEATSALEETIRTAPPGVMLISAECGLGKTEAAIKVAAERAAKQHSSPKATGKRAPLQSKTSISVDKNSLAKQIQARLAQLGTPAKRFFGPLSVLKADGTPECHYHEVAQHLVSGGQSMQRELCEGRGLFKCDHYESCKARLGCEGPDDARVTIGSHALISALDGAAGATGLLVVDEPPHLLETTPITLHDLRQTETMLYAFDRDYVDAMRPALLAVRAWIEEATEDTGAMDMKKGVRMFSAAVDPAILDMAQMATEADADVVACAANAPFPDARGTAPPLRQVEVARARQSPKRAWQIGKASGVLSCVHYALAAPWGVVGSVQKEKGEPVFMVTAARKELIEAMRREGAVVVMDANIDVHAGIYEKALRYTPPMRHFSAGDGATIGRTHLWCASAIRTQWMRAGKLVPKASLVNAVREVFKWAKADPEATKLGLITLMPISLALDCILHPDDQRATEAWEKAGQLSGTLKELRRMLAPIFAQWGGEIILGHYGAVRGLNTMANVDCLATLGDPWPNIGQVARDMEYLGMPDQSDDRMEALCRAELEQAHGRLRTVHRTRPGRALHVGRVLPGGSGWCDGRVSHERMSRGRPGANEPMSTKALKVIIAKIGSVSAAAKAAGCSRAYLIQCRDGKRPISQKITDSLLAA